MRLADHYTAQWSGSVERPGIAEGVVGLLPLTRVMRSLLSGIRSTNPRARAGMSLSLAMVSLSVCYVHAQRVAREFPS